MGDGSPQAGGGPLPLRAGRGGLDTASYQFKTSYEPHPRPFTPFSVSYLFLLQRGIEQDVLQFSSSEVAVVATGQPYCRSFSTVSFRAVLLVDRVAPAFFPSPPSFFPKSQEGGYFASGWPLHVCPGV